jgi:hypothetical protein
MVNLTGKSESSYQFNKNNTGDIQMIRNITLTTEYKIDFDDEGGLEYLFNAIIGEDNTKLKDREESSERGLSAVYHNCMCELHYVAGQLHHMGSELNIKKLVDEFGFHWDKVAEKLGRSDMIDDDNSTVPTDSYDESEDCIEQLFCDRRLQRGTDCEYWILDGKKESGEERKGIGSLVIIYDANGRFVAQGIISKEYSISFTEDDLQQFLKDTLGRFGIDLGAGGTLQFMCSDYYIDIGF